MDAKMTVQQIGTGNLMACGARDFAADDTTLTFRVGPSGKLSKIIIVLEACDTYTVRYFSMNKKTYEVTKEEAVSGIYADQLGATVRQMGDREVY